MNDRPTGAALVREVFSRVRAGEATVADLYAPDAVVIVGPQRIEGRETIRAFYANSIEALGPQPEVQVVLEYPGSANYAAIVEVPTKDGHVHAFDLFTLGDDGIQQLEIFTRILD